MEASASSMMEQVMAAELMKGNCWKDRRDAKDRKGNPIVTYPVYVEDKHDEIRCHVLVTQTEVKYLSYAGKPLANMERFNQTFLTIARGTGYREFDLGFEVNGNFNDSYRWVRSTKGIPADLKDATFKFLVFGLPEFEGKDTLSKQYGRRVEVALYSKDWVSVPFVVPETVLCDNAHDVDNAFLNARARSLEGVMVKQPGHLYERKRTDGWLKMKPEDDADGVIVELIEATATVADPERGIAVGDPLGRIGSVRVRMEDGSEACPHGIAHDLGRDMYKNPLKYYDEWCEFKFMWRDRQGGYRHPTFFRLREAK
jgi:hypothetical protein